jgi:hypothetical protein
LNPGHLEPLRDTAIGRTMAAVAIALLVAGTFLMRRIATSKV